MRLRALIVDDEPLAHEVILGYAADIPFVEIVGRCHRATDALEILHREEIDLLFLDIQMPRLNGLEMLRILKRRPQVIVTSAHQEYALEGYELEVCDYLLKPFRFQRFLEACQRALERSSRGARSGATAGGHARSGGEGGTREGGDGDAERTHPRQHAEHLLLKVDQRWLNVPLAEVTHLESYGNYVKVWTGESYHLTLRTLVSFEEELPSRDFRRIHKSYIVNRRHVAYLQDNALRLRSGESLPIGKSRRRETLGFLAGDAAPGS